MSLRAQARRDTARSVSFHAHQEFIDRARNEMKTKGYRLSQRNRKKIEELFGEAKEQMGFRRMKLRRLKFVIEQALLTAAAQNIKRLVKHLEKHAPNPAQSAKVSRKNREFAFLAPFFRFTLEIFDCDSTPTAPAFLFSN
jgi:hypothetical protein